MISMKNLPPSSRRSASLDSAFSTSSPTTPFFSLRIHTPSPKRLPKRFIYICTASVLAFTLLVGLSYHSHSYVTLPFFPSSDDTSFKIEPGKEGLAEIIKVFKGLPPYNVESYVTPDPLTFLGVQADASYRLESSNITVYREQLTSFIKNAFPASLQQSLVSGLDLYLPPLSSPPLEAAQYPYPTFPKKIWQTHKDRNIRPEDSWRIQIGYEYTFWDDAGLDTWVSNTFGKDSGIWWLWETLELGITKSDLFRYLVLLIEGGIYSDMDTRLLKPIDFWGATDPAYLKGSEPFNGPPSIIIGIESDVGSRSDWNEWWTRPIQMAQWTMASSPGHPILLDTIRRIFFFTTRVSAWKVANANNTAVLDQFRDELNAAMGPINVLEWTGPGVWSDAFMRYVLAKYDIKWNQFRDMKTPLRATEMCVLPVTGFSPGTGHHMSKGLANEQAMVAHLFAGTWKPP